MTEAIIVCIIANFVAIITCLLNNKNSIDKIKLEQEDNRKQLKSSHEESMNEIIERSDKTIAMIELKLDALTKQVEKHNTVIERMYLAEKDISLLQSEDNRANKRLQELEHLLQDIMKGAK